MLQWKCTILTENKWNHFHSAKQNVWWHRSPMLHSLLKLNASKLRNLPKDSTLGGVKSPPRASMCGGLLLHMFFHTTLFHMYSICSKMMSLKSASFGAKDYKFEKGRKSGGVKSEKTEFTRPFVSCCSSLLEATLAATSIMLPKLQLNSELQCV